MHSTNIWCRLMYCVSSPFTTNSGHQVEIHKQSDQGVAYVLLISPRSDSVFFLFKIRKIILIHLAILNMINMSITIYKTPQHYLVFFPLLFLPFQTLKDLANALSSVKLQENSLIRICWPKNKCSLLKDDVVLVDRYLNRPYALFCGMSHHTAGRTCFDQSASWLYVLHCDNLIRYTYISHSERIEINYHVMRQLSAGE